MTRSKNAILPNLLFALVLAVLLAGVAFAPPTARAATTQAATVPAGVQTDADWGRMPLYFTANQGQLDAAVAYYVSGADKTLYFTPQGVTFALAQAGFSPGPEEAKTPSAPAERWSVKLDYLGARTVGPRGQDKTEAVISYFKGSPEDWEAGIPTYSSLLYPDLWPGIDLVYSGTADQLKQEFLLEPGADPDKIRLSYQGAEVTLNQKGQLEVSTPFGSFTDEAPLAYQEVNGKRVPVSAGYALETFGAGVGQASAYGFTLGTYDPSLPLVIDPLVRIYCGFIGGSANDYGYGIAVDSAGCAYVTGDTSSDQTSFPEVAGPYLTSSGYGDAFVAKVNAAGTGLAYCGFIGGSSDDFGYGIAVDSAGCAYVTGTTYSNQTSFPVVGGPYLTHKGGWDAFVAKVNAAGTGLTYCGFIGGSGEDQGKGIAVDSAGCAYVTGSTASDQTSFPVVAGGRDLTYNGNTDAFVAKVNAAGTGLTYCDYLGGSVLDSGNGIAVDSTGCAYITGQTGSPEATFPVTGGPDLTLNGGTDAFVAKLTAAGTGLVYCGYIGGTGFDNGIGIAVDSGGRAYVTGMTYSTETSFPVVAGPYLTHSGSTDAFVAKVTAAGTGLAYCGYIGGSSGDQGSGIAVDSAGCAYVTGMTYSNETSFPVVAGPDLTFNGNTDAFVAKVNSSGSGLVYCGYLGGSAFDCGSGIAVNSAGNAYVVGWAGSDQSSFPALAGPGLTFSGGVDAFVAKVGVRSAPSAFNDGSLANQPGPVTLNVVANDTDPDNDLVAASVDLDPNTPGQQTSLFAPGGDGWGSGTWSTDAAGNVTFTPPPMQPNDPCYDPLPIFYRVSDETLLVSNLALITVDYVHVPIATDDSSSGNLPGPVTVDVLANDTRGGQTNPVTVDVDPSTAGQQTLLVVTGEGTWSTNPTTGAITFTPLVGFIGDPTPIFYTVEDYDLNVSNQARVTVTYALPVNRYQQTDSRLTYLGSWSYGSTWLASGGSFYYTSAKGAAVVVEFRGTAIDIIATTGPGYGKAVVTLDGSEKTVDLYNSTTVYKKSVYKKTGLGNIPHALTIRCAEEPSSSGFVIALDALDITGALTQAPVPARYQQDDGSFEYTGPWATNSPANWSLSGGTFASVDAPGSSVNVEFTGTYLAWYATTGRGYGKAQVTLDAGTPDEVTTTVDLYAPYTKYKQRVYDTGFLKNESHTLSIYWIDQKNAAATGTRINVDTFDLFGTLGNADPAPPILWRYQQTDSRIAYLGSWSTGSTWSASGGSFYSTGVTGAAAVVKFTGTSVKLIAKKCQWYGIASVQLDDEPDAASVDLYSLTTLYKEPVYGREGLTPGEHTLTIKCTGTPSPGHTGTSISLDALDITGYLTTALTRYQQDDPHFLYTGSWSTSPTWSASGGSYASVDTSGAQITVNFTGSYLAWYAKTAPWYGKATVTLDSGSAFEVDLYSATTGWKKQVYNTGLLDDKPHTLTIQWSGLKNPAASGTTIDVDAFDVIGTL